MCNDSVKFLNFDAPCKKNLHLNKVTRYSKVNQNIIYFIETKYKIISQKYKIKIVVSYTKKIGHESSSSWT